jgi:hypothetical protein
VADLSRGQILEVKPLDRPLAVCGNKAQVEH